MFKLYHWHGVLQDRYAGDIVVYASSVEQARDLARYRIKEYYNIVSGCQTVNFNCEDQDGYSQDLETIDNINPVEYDYPIAISFVGSA